MIRRIPFDWNIISTSFESAFCTKAIEVDYLKMSENTDSAGMLLFKARAHFYLRLGSHLYAKNKIRNYNSVSTGAHKIGKILSLWPNFDPYFPKIWTV